MTESGNLAEEPNVSGRITSAEIAKRLRQTEHAGQRSSTIPTFAKYLRRGDRFQPTWDAIGGARGLADLMAEFSVRDVRAVCRGLRRTATAVKARPARRAAMGDLVAMLYDGNNTDHRPLQRFYQGIIPACELSVVQAWEPKVKWTHSEQKTLLFAHRKQHETKFLNDVFSPDTIMTFAENKQLFRGNVPFCKVILEKLEATDDDILIPRDLVDGLIMPLLKRLSSKNFDDETRDNFLGLVVRCFQKHAIYLKTELDLRRGGLVYYTLQRWIDTRRDQKLLQSYLTQLLSLRETSRWNTIGSVHNTLQALKGLNASNRYRLLRLLFQYMQEYRLDLEDESPAGLARLKAASSSKDLWPSLLLMSIDRDKAYALFEKLERLHPGVSFLACPSPGSVLCQTHAPGDPGGDVEVFRTILSRSVPTREPLWLDRVQAVVKERKKKATESREPEGRAYWASSAFSLCVAASDLSLLLETSTWARRFNRDSLTTSHLYNDKVLGTRELQSLLCAIPKRGDEESIVNSTVESVNKDIDRANQVLLVLIETAVMAIPEPGFHRSKWNTILHLPKVVADERLCRSDSFKAIAKASDKEASIADIVWKPTMDTLLRLEAMLRAPAAQALLGPYTQIDAPAVDILRGVRGAPAAVLANLVEYFIQGIVTHLGPEALKAQMGNIVEVVLRLADSDQPSLASPFIRDIIKNGNDSSWHRRVLNTRFLQALPAAAAHDFIQNMASAMHDLMKEQNARPWVEGQAPVIKVTTVKMMAQVLEGNLFLDPASSCGILVSLLTEVRHIDARITIVSSLMATLMEPTCSLPLQHQILDALETRVVPIAAQLNERRPTTEEDWHAAALPDIGDQTPLLSLLVQKAGADVLSDENKTRLVRIIINILQQSAVNNNRWMHAFLEKNGFRLDPGERLPVGPVNIRILVSVCFQWTASIPLSLFELLRDTALVRVSPSPGISRVTKAIKTNGELITSNAGRHWLAQYDDPDALSFNNGVQQAIVKLGLLDLEGAAVGVPALQAFVLAAAERMVRRGDPVYDLIKGLTTRRFDSRSHWSRWKTNCVPIVRDLISAVEEMRRRGLGGSLPSKVRLEVEVLPIPYSSTKEPSVAVEVDNYASEISRLIDHLATRRLPYHEDFARLKEGIVHQSRNLEPLTVAVKLARLGEVSSVEEPSLNAYLRLELVVELLEITGKINDDAVAEEARRLIQGLKECRAEGLRDLGFRIKHKVLQKEGEVWFA